MSRFAPSLYPQMPVGYHPRPPHPITPPETDLDSQHLHASAFVFPSPAIDTENTTHTFVSLPERSESRFRKAPTLSYFRSGPQDAQERPFHRSPKHLIVVRPPPNFAQEYGQLGHTLSVGPRHRLSNGILMPLFPTMYGQLTAIAREFNFPSAAGLCLYLQVTENGVVMTPRISDDTWSILWGHLFEAGSPSTYPLQLPIGGYIEFDIDYSKARWYDSWIASAYRDAGPTAFAGSPMHRWRNDSRTTFADEHIEDEHLQDHSVPRLTKSRNPTNRHIPKKLSLVDRRDASSIQSISKASLQATVMPLERQMDHILSPIPQSAELQSVHRDLEKRVNSWRVGASLIADRTEESSQPLSATEALPHSTQMVDAPAAETVQPELNLDDFTWSITSAGPSSGPLDSPASPYRLPSVHIASRMQGSVQLTPTVAASLGRPEDDLGSVHSDLDDFPLELAEHQTEERPHTPSVATSWGPPLSDPPTPISPYRPPSVHLADRGIFSLPATPDSPNFLKRHFSHNNPPASTHDHFDPTSSLSHNMLQHLPWKYAWPFYQTDHEDATVPMDFTPWKYVWPYQRTVFDTNTPSSSTRKLDSLSRQSTYPYIEIFPSVYPHFNLYPARAGDPDRAIISPVSQAARYPVFDIYPAVYPYFNIYPPMSSMADVTSIRPMVDQSQKYIDVRLHAKYPTIEIYPAVYPFNLRSIYLNVHAAKHAFISVDPPVHYPHFNLYPSVYPHISPDHPRSLSPTSHQASLTVESRSDVKVEFAPAYPTFDLYPTGYPLNLVNIYPPIMLEVRTAIVTKLPVSYPDFDIYPAVYPAFDIYPAPPASADAVVAERYSRTLTQTLSSASYPAFNLYPAIYPSFNLYPTVYSSRSMPNHSENVIHSGVKSTWLYPILVIYPAAYPHFDLYPVLPDNSTKHQHLSVISTRLVPEYPTFDIYPGVYPHLRLYPEITLELGITSHTASRPKISVKLQEAYPFFELYPAVYPHFSIYPPGRVEMTDRGQHATNSTRLLANYPTFDLYPSVYPFLDIYPSPPLLDAVQPVISPIAKISKVHRRVIKNHAQLHNETFGSGVIWTPSGYAQDLESLLQPQKAYEPPSKLPSPISSVPRALRSRSGTVTRRMSSAPSSLGESSAAFVTSSLPISSVKRACRPLSGVPEPPSPSQRSPILRSSSSLRELSSSSSPTRETAKGAPGMRLNGSLPVSPSGSIRKFGPQAAAPSSTSSQGQSSDYPPQRRTSMVLPQIPTTRVSGDLGRAQSLSKPGYIPRKEGTVLQRARAYDQSTAKNEAELSPGSTMSLFPMPPRHDAPLPAAAPINKLDRSKLPFA